MVASLAWNWDNRLRSADVGGTPVLQLKYDPDGNRVFKHSSRFCWAERAAIMEFDGNLPREQAERAAYDNALETMNR